MRELMVTTLTTSSSAPDRSKKAPASSSQHFCNRASLVLLASFTNSPESSSPLKQADERPEPEYIDGVEQHILEVEQVRPEDFQVVAPHGLVGFVQLIQLADEALVAKLLQPQGLVVLRGAVGARFLGLQDR